MNYQQLKKQLYQHECEHPNTHLTACITFSSFGLNNQKEYSWNSRTYLVSSDNKVFQPNKGGYSIYASCLDGTDQLVRLEQYMTEERGGKDGWVVEDCCIVGYLLIESSDLNTHSPKLFYSYSEAMEYMLSQLAEKSELDVERLKRDYAAMGELSEDGQYGASRDSVWFADSYEDWHWKIHPVFIYGPLNMVFPEDDDISSLIYTR